MVTRWIKSPFSFLCLIWLIYLIPVLETHRHYHEMYHRPWLTMKRIKDKCVNCLTSEKCSASPAFFFWDKTSVFFFFFSDSYPEEIKSQNGCVQLKIPLSHHILRMHGLFKSIYSLFSQESFSLRKNLVPFKIVKRVRIPFIHKSYELSSFSQHVCQWQPF